MRIILLIFLFATSMYGYGQVPSRGHNWNYGLDSTGRLGYQKETYVVAKSYEAARCIRNVDTFDIIRITANKIYGDFKLDLSDLSSPDDTAMILVNTSGQRLKRIVYDRIDCKWFGCLGDGVTNDWYNMQRGINWSINHPEYPRWFFISKGFYIIGNGISLQLINSNTYQFFSIKISGEKGVTYFGKENYLTQVAFTNVNEFGFNFQNCRASEISGLIVSGQYICPINFNPDGKQFYRTKFTDFYDGVCRTDRYSPHVGICTDALRGDGSAPPGGGYSRFASQYTTVTGSGCSGLTITDVSIRSFVVAFAASVGGGSPNSENIQLETVEFRENIVGYSSGQSQEKENSVKHLTSWWPQHTVFDNLNFGAGSGVCPNIDGVNIAGYCIRAFNINNSGYYLTSANNIFAESILQIGNLNGLMNVKLMNSTFDLLANPGWPEPEWVVNCNNTTFDNVTIRRYSGAHERWPMAAFNSTFIGCTFGGVPILLNNEYRTAQAANLKFINCSINTSSGIIISEGGIYGVPGGASVPVTHFLPHGKATIRYSESIQLRYDDAKFFRFQSSVETVTLIADTVNNKAKFYTPNTSRYQVGDVILNDNNGIVYYDNGSGDNIGGGPQWFGIVDSVLTDTIKLRDINRELASGSSSKTLAFDRLVYTGKLFVGDVANGSKVISNVKVYDINNWPTVGYTMDWPTGSFNNTVYVTAVDTAAKTITVNWVSGQTQKGVRFFNNNPQIIRNYQSAFYNSNAMFDGLMFTDDEISADVVPAANSDISIKPTFKILNSGYKDSAGAKKAIIKNMYGKSVVDTAGNYSTLGVEDVVNVNATSGNSTVTLFSATDTKYWGKNILIKKVDSSANTVTVNISSTDSIDGGTSVVLSSVYNWVEVVSNGRGKFRIINQTGSGGGAVSSVANSDGTLTISPTTGNVVPSLNLAHANTWTAAQTINNSVTIANTGLIGLNINSTNTGNSAYPINFNRATVSVQNAFNMQTGGTDEWFVGVDNDGTEDYIVYDWVAAKYILKAVSSSGDIAFGNSLSALYVRQADQNIGVGTSTPAYGLTVNKSMGLNKDSALTLSAIGSGMLLVLDTGSNKIFKILTSNLGFASGNTLYTGDGTLSANRTVTGASKNMVFNGIFNYTINSNCVLLSNSTGTHVYSMGSGLGSDKIFELGYTPTPTVYSKGAGITIDTNNNASLGAAQIPTTAPLYTTGSAFANGLQNQGGNYLLVTSITSNTTVTLSNNFYVIDATGGSIVVTIPSASSAFGASMGLDLIFKRIDNSLNTITIQRNGTPGTDTIDGASSFTLLTQYEAKKIRAISTSAWAIY